MTGDVRAAAAAGVVDLAGADLAARLDAFAAAFTTLGALLRRPADQSFLDTVRDTELLEEWPVRGDDDSERGLVLLRDAVTSGEDAAAVRADHNRLFVGPGHLLAPPYESVYRSRDGLVFEAETLQVRARYAAWGMQAPNLHREPDDHLGLELEFLAALCLRALDAIDSGDDEVLRAALVEIAGFLDEHVLQWAPACMQDVTAGAHTAWFGGVAALVQGTLHQAERILVTAV